MLRRFFVVYSFLWLFNYSSIACAEDSLVSPQDRGFWSDMKEQVASLIGLAAPTANEQASETSEEPIIAPSQINEEIIEESETSGCSNCEMVICGNLIVTGTIIAGCIVTTTCQQFPPTPPVLSGCPQLKIVHGTFTTPSHGDAPVIISCSGNCAKQCNWSVVRTGSPSSTSEFTVTFNPAFSSIPTVVAVTGKAGGGGQVTVDLVSPTTAVFDTNSSPDTVHFIAISCCG